MTKRHLILACADLAIRLQQTEHVVAMQDIAAREMLSEIGRLKNIIELMVDAESRERERVKLRKWVNEAMGCDG